ncbi:MAG: hypothetical protein P4L03_09050 [Terracidiphilus sp.]|nr:hypothetical protein [Terracidiphilus sp.]
MKKVTCLSVRACIALFSALCLHPFASAQAHAPGIDIHYEQPIENANYPELLYWFVTPETLNPAQYQRDIRHILEDSPFDFPFLTVRNGVRLFESPAAHEAVAGIVREAHRNHLRIGTTFPLQEIDSMRKPSFEDAQTVIADGESILDANGQTTFRISMKARSATPLKTELLRAVVFRKTAEGEYDPATLSDVTSQVESRQIAPDALEVTLHLGPGAAGLTAFAMSSTWYKAFDLFSDAYTQWVHEAIDSYRDVPFDGTSLDEFGYLRIPMYPVTPWRGHLGGKAFATQFEKATGKSLTQTLFETRYAPAGHSEVRIRAINIYWEFLPSGPLRIEEEFFRHSRQVFGPNNFAGIHDTFHNHLDNDEAWATGINWWVNPRQYGMSDEDLSLPLRMGLLVSHPGPIIYDQFYGFDIERFATKAMNDARFGARLHYHGYNDTGRWGVDLSSAAFLSKLNPVERKIRLLNRFNGAAPKLPLLVVFGMPALLNWYPNTAARNAFDLNGSLHVEEKANAIWKAGYRCAVIPSSLIDNGSVQLDAANHPVLNGHAFEAIVYLYPQYAKRTTFEFLSRFTAHGGALMLEGDASRDFDGGPIAELFHKIAANARVRGFDVEKIALLGVQKSPLDGLGEELEDGSTILTDLASIETGRAKDYSIHINGHNFTGAYKGVLAIQANADGTLRKLACGDCGTVLRDGHPLLVLRTPADLVLTQGNDGRYHAVIEGESRSNTIELHQDAAQ